MFGFPNPRNVMGVEGCGRLQFLVLILKIPLSELMKIDGQRARKPTKNTAITGEYANGRNNRVISGDRNG